MIKSGYSTIIVVVLVILLLSLCVMRPWIVDGLHSVDWYSVVYLPLISAAIPTQNVFVQGYFNSGSRWMHKVIRANACLGTLVHPDQHKFVSLSGTAITVGKHSRIDSKTLQKENVDVVILLVRDFESWVQATLRNPYQSGLNESGIIPSHMGWRGGPVYSFYTNLVKSQVNLLVNSHQTFMIVSLKQAQDTKGKIVIDFLKSINIGMVSSFQEVTEHTKVKGFHAMNRDYQDLKYDAHSDGGKDSEFESLMARLEIKPILSDN
jgi:hypothetical protein